MHPELAAHIKDLQLRRSVLLRNIGITVIGRTLEFAEDSLKALGEISVDEWKNAVKNVFCEEMDKL
jgi:hypothetical protein